jgi:type IV pilus assembly protein PilY1
MRAVNTRTLTTLLGLLACQTFIANTADAVSIGLSDIPIYVREGVQPNIFLTVDDSTSMQWSHMPDGIQEENETNRVKSHTYNPLYFNPDFIYTPPVDGTGASLGNATFTAAWSDGYHQSSTCTVDLSTSFRPTWASLEADNCDGFDTVDRHSSEFAGGPEPAYYYRFDNLLGDGDTSNDANYTKVVVGEAQQQNFANWYSYYRNRLYAAKAAITHAFATFGPIFRISRQTINNQSLSTLAEYSGATRQDFYNWIIGLTASGRTPLRTALQNVGQTLSNSDDPYRDDPSDPNSSASSCRQNFHVLMTDGRQNGPGVSVGNVDGTTHTLPTNDFGITTYSSTEGYAEPYEDDNSHYLADLAFYYWANDLRPAANMPNNVPYKIDNWIFNNSNGTNQPTVDNAATFWHPNNDPANWQHLVNFTISFGVDGTLNYPDDLENLIDGTTDWGSDVIDDIWHTAINSRGRYLSARDPKVLAEKFDEVVKTALYDRTTAAPVSLNAGSVSSETRLYQVIFHTADWSGELLSLPISDGSNNSTCTANDEIGDVCAPEWEAGCKLTGGYCEETGATETALDWNTGRNIITLNANTGTGIPFRWDNLYTDESVTTDQQDLLNLADGRGSDRLNYLRGNRSQEAQENNAGTCADCTFRNRNSVLGDLINSSPVYVGAPSRIYPDDMEDVDHSDFREAQSKRQGMVYVGGNDGMLHGFSASDGTEELAYVPNIVFPKLALLTEPHYSHASFVDGQLEEADAFFDSAWHTVLAGGLGYGGQGVYALDITSPESFAEANAGNIALWEYSDADDADLGYTYGKPLIRKLNNGTWAAIFANGYDSTVPDDNTSETGNAAIYIVDISNGELIKKISTGVGAAQDPTGDARPNGIADIQPVDINKDYVIDFIYAGDLFGNIWRFNLEGSDPTQWGVAFDGKPLYTAKDDDNNVQPITTLPAVGRHITYTGTMVYFGTGKYLGINDATDTSQQTFYGIWDRWFDNDADTNTNEANFTALSRSDLLEQEILGTNDTQFSEAEARVTTDTPIDWATHQGWYLDLTESGERVFQKPLLRNERIIFVTVTPSDEPCETGGSSWLMELDANSGARLDNSPFDYSGDSVFTSDDQVELDTDGDGKVDSVAGSGIRLGDDIYTIPAVLQMPDEDSERKYIGKSDGTVEDIEETSGRRLKQSWRQVKDCGI